MPSASPLAATRKSPSSSPPRATTQKAPLTSAEHTFRRPRKKTTNNAPLHKTTVQGATLPSALQDSNSANVVILHPSQHWQTHYTLPQSLRTHLQITTPGNFLSQLKLINRMGSQGAPCLLRVRVPGRRTTQPSRHSLHRAPPTNTKKRQSTLLGQSISAPSLLWLPRRPGPGVEKKNRDNIQTTS